MIVKLVGKKLPDEYCIKVIEPLYIICNLQTIFQKGTLQYKCWESLLPVKINIINDKVENQRTTMHKYQISYLYTGKHKLVMKIKQLQTQAIKTAVCMVALQLPCKFSSGQLSKHVK